MTLSLGKLPAGLPGIDTSGGFTLADARAAYAAGKRVALFCIGLPDVSEDATEERIANACAAGLAVGLYGFYRSGSWSADTGAFDARLHIARAPKNVPDGAPVFCDIELPGGQPPTADALMAYLRAYLAVRRTDPRKLAAGLYVAKVPLTAAQVSSLGFDVLWHSGMDGTPTGPGLIYQLEQLRAVPGVTMNVRLANAIVDLDETRGEMTWIVDPAAFTPAAPDTAPPPAVRPPPADAALPAWLLALRAPNPGESPGAHVARIVRAFAGVSLHTRRDELEALFRVNETAARAPQIAALQTNCGTFLREAWCLAGCPDHFVTQPYEGGMAVTWDLEAARELGALVDCRTTPDAWQMAREGWGLHYGTPGTNNDHMEFCLGTPDPKTGVCEHGGGGRADNAVTIGRGDIRWSLGRPLLHVIDPGRLRLPVAPPPPPETRPDLPSLIDTPDATPTRPSQPAAQPPDQARPPTPTPPAAPATRRPVGPHAITTASILSAAGAVWAWAQAHPWLAGGAVVLAVLVAIVAWELHRRASRREHRAALIASLQRLKEQEPSMSSPIDDLIAAVTAHETVDQGVIALLNGLTAKLADEAAQLAAAGVDVTKIQALTAQIQAGTKAMSDAVVANTPAAPAPKPAA